MTVSSTQNSETRMAAKRALRKALEHHHGEPAHAVVAAAIADLAPLNPTPAPARHVAMQSNWRLISAPNFPDGERQADGTYVYTLGRLAFNMFQPQDLKVVIQQVTQPVLPIAGTQQHSHDIVVHFKTLSEVWPPLEGIVRNLGVCQPNGDATLQVQFTGGQLEPAEGTDWQQWQTLLGKPSGPRKLTPRGWLQGLFLQLMFGLVPPQGMDTSSGKVEFKMRRSPKGTLTILYLDDELRITRGNQETVLVCERI